MYYISIHDIVTHGIGKLKLSPEQSRTILEKTATGGLEELANYFNQEDISLRNQILSDMGMDVIQRVDIYSDQHRVLNGNGRDIYTGTRWVGRTVAGDSTHEMYQELASNEKYDGIAAETGARIFPEGRKLLKQNPEEKLAIREGE